MNIDRMHSTFRVIGQQMGMQLVRGILPESIDTFINAEIGEFVQTELLTNAHTVLQDNVNLQSMTMSPINLFRTLYRKDEIPLKLSADDAGYVKKDLEVGYYKIYIPNKTNIGNEEYGYPVHNTSMNGAKGWSKKALEPMLYLGVNIATIDDKPGRYKACRLIGADVLETTLRDYCNGADKNNPIAVLLGESIDVFTAINENLKFDKTINAEYFEIYTNTKDFEIDRIYLSYIKYPNIVHWDIEPSKKVDCDLPEYIHYRIVEGAVRRFLISINNGSVNSELTKNNN